MKRDRDTETFFFFTFKLSNAKEEIQNINKNIKVNNLFDYFIA